MVQNYKNIYDWIYENGTPKRQSPSHAKEKQNRERSAIRGRQTSGGKRRPTFRLIFIS